MDDREFEAALDDLFSQAPDDFVNARNALVRQLKSANRREDAARVTRWRRPTRTAWALNRLAQASQDTVVALVDAASAVRESQAAGGTGVREALAELRQATRQATDAAVAAIAPARPADQTDVASALHAVLSDADSLTLLARGRLLEIPEPGLSGFGTAPNGQTGSSKASSTDEAGRRKALREAIQQARKAAKQAKTLKDQADADVGEASTTLQTAQDRRDRLRLDLAEAEDAVEAAEAATEQARSTAAAAAEDLADAESALAELDRADTG
jgi:hypothetical protein